MALDPHLETAKVDFCVDTLLTLAIALKRAGHLDAEMIDTIGGHFEVLEQAAANSEWNARDRIQRQRTLFNCS